MSSMDWTKKQARHRIARRMVCLLMAAVGVVAPLNGCGRSAGDPPGTVRMTIWSGWSGQEEKFFQQVLDRYHELHPNIIIENLGAVNDDNKTVRAIVAGAPPDVFTIWNLFYLG